MPPVYLYAMSQQTTRSDDVLPFDLSDVRGGVGTVERIVDLGNYTEAEEVFQGRCNFCGYDRGTFKSHTDVRASSLTCRQCHAVLGGES